MCTFNGSDSWVILTPIEQSIKHKIESVGTPLRDWDINIYRGVLTGYNEAFIISTEKRDEILAKCKSEDERTRTAELIRPILRGRDIKRYGYDWAGLWLINTHNGVKGKYPPIDIKDYPAVKKHLDSYWDKIEKRDDKGVTPYNLRNCAYMDDFFKPKIVWASVGETSYSLVPKEYLLLDTNYFFAIDNPSELLAILNSKLITWWINSEDTQLGNGGAWRHYKYNLEKLHIPQNTNVFKEFIKNILHNISVKESILSIDRKVYALYNLTEQEIAFIENREP